MEKKYQYISCYPNPVTVGNSIAIQFENQNGGNYKLQLYNYIGQPVSHAIINVAAGTSSGLFSLNGVAAGCYQLEIVSAEGLRQVSRIIVQDK
jgi:hypothetical protein